MKHILTVSFLMLSVILAGQLYGQQTLSEGTIYFDVTVQTGERDPQMADVFDGAKAILSMRDPARRIGRALYFTRATAPTGAAGGNPGLTRGGDGSQWRSAGRFAAHDGALCQSEPD